MITDPVCLQYVDNVDRNSGLKSMEELNINNGNGQSYGFILYRTKLTGAQLKTGSQLTIRGRPRDLVQVLINGVMLSKPVLVQSDLDTFGTWAVRYYDF